MTIITAPFWYALKGAAKYVTAIATGAVAPEAVQADRAERCAACEERSRYSALGQFVWTCGPAGVDRLASPTNPTCGCLVYSRPKNQVALTAAGKTVVASERCPQGKWSTTARLNAKAQEAP